MGGWGESALGATSSGDVQGWGEGWVGGSVVIRATVRVTGATGRVTGATGRVTGASGRVTGATERANGDGVTYLSTPSPMAGV
jgi:hypothetical protein